MEAGSEVGVFLHCFSAAFSFQEAVSFFKTEEGDDSLVCKNAHSDAGRRGSDTTFLNFKTLHGSPTCCIQNSNTCTCRLAHTHMITCKAVSVVAVVCAAQGIKYKLKTLSNDHRAPKLLQQQACHRRLNRNNSF